MSNNYLGEFLPDLEEFRDMTMKFHSGEITKMQYKGFSGGYGSYAQRGGEKHMLRLRTTGGRVTKENLKFIVDSCKKYDIDRIKLTTCQSIQFHNLDSEAVCDAMKDAWEAGLISRGGGGDFPRNVMATSLSGVTEGEKLDVMPYARVMADFLMGFIKTVKMPRKLKVCFSNSESNETHATFRDLGFVVNENGNFDVYIAGGLGSNSRLGVLAAEDVDPSKILYYAKAMILTFVAYGNYEKRNKARTRYMQETLGVDGLKKAYLEKLAEVMEGNKLNFVLPVREINKKGDGIIEDKRVKKQKQEGLYSVIYHPIGGNLPPETIVKLYETVKDMEDVELRITPEESMYIINCTASEAAKVIEATKDSARDLFETSVACIGNSICQVGARDSQALLKTCVEAVRNENFADGVLPKIHISGCPSSCSAHQIGDIGFRGAMKKTADGSVPGFAFFAGGCALQKEENICKAGKVMAIDDIPLFLVELGKVISEKGTTYKEWIKDNREELDKLAAKYTD